HRSARASITKPSGGGPGLKVGEESGPRKGWPGEAGTAQSAKRSRPLFSRFSRFFHQLLHSRRGDRHLRRSQQGSDRSDRQPVLGVQGEHDPRPLGLKLSEPLFGLVAGLSGRGERLEPLGDFRGDHAPTSPRMRYLAANADHGSRSTTGVGTASGAPSSPCPTCPPAATTTSPWWAPGARHACASTSSRRSSGDQQQESPGFASLRPVPSQSRQWVSSPVPSQWWHGVVVCPVPSHSEHMSSSWLAPSQWWHGVVVCPVPSLGRQARTMCLSPVPSQEGHSYWEPSGVNALPQGADQAWSAQKQGAAFWWKR